MLPAQPNQSLIDGLAVLQALASAGKPLGSREMARQLNLEPTRVNRLLKTLAFLGLARQTADKQYSAGAGMHVLAAQAMFGSGLLHRAIGPLAELRRFKLSAALGVLWRDHVAYLYHAGPGTRPVDAIGNVGLFPATRSGIGRMLLSQLPDADVSDLFRGRELPSFAGAGELLDELKTIRGAGYALVRPFDDLPTRTVAVAIENESAAVALSGEFETRDLRELVEALRNAARTIGRET